MKKWPLLVLFLLFLSFTGFAQSNTFLDEVLEREEVLFGGALKLVFSGAGLLPEDVTEERAIAYLESQDWGIAVKGTAQTITLGEYSLVVMKALDLPGGIMYSIASVPRYAVRELDYLGFIDGSTAPGRTLSGEEAVRVLGRALEWRREES
jgi:hypothetical protein